MYDPALRRAKLLAQGQEAVEGAHAVEDQRLAVGFAQTDVEGEKLLLHGPISAQAVKTTFAKGHNFVARGPKWQLLLQLCEFVGRQTAPPRMDTNRIVRIGEGRKRRCARQNFKRQIDDGRTGRGVEVMGMKIEQTSHGTGSYPLPPHGWQRKMRRTANQRPLKSPCFCSASIAYCEQVGVKRHEGGVSGEIKR